MNYRRLEIIINKEIDILINDFMNKKINELKERLNISKTFSTDYTINIALTFEGIFHFAKLNQLKISCLINDGKSILQKEFFTKNYRDLYTMLKFDIKHRDDCFLIILKPELSINDNNLMLIKIRDIYYCNSYHPLENIINYTDFKNIRDKIYLCLLVFAVNSKMSNFIEDILSQKLDYYGYDKFIDNDFNHKIVTIKNLEELTNLFFCLIYNLIQGNIGIDSNRYEQYANRLMNEYKRLV